ncbi:hypothetical protein [Kosakonia sacchari]|uniref:hypothetical protein n=1 Tax=Kosakonia sacchari TaxID=1158459 RepID=UPI001F0B1BF6|nr:hypothetical protein [Kosakonia sacchari]
MQSCIVLVKYSDKEEWLATALDKTRKQLREVKDVMKRRICNHGQTETCRFAACQIQPAHGLYLPGRKEIKRPTSKLSYDGKNAVKAAASVKYCPQNNAQKVVRPPLCNAIIKE